jgi:hypothetical protein
VKNITVSVPDEVYRAARVRAAERDSSVSAIVTEYLRGLACDDAEFVRLRAQQKRIQREIETFRAGDRLSREDLHRRAIR